MVKGVNSLISGEIDVSGARGIVGKCYFINYSNWRCGKAGLMSCPRLERI